jgi:hypothetical protein
MFKHKIERKHGYKSEVKRISREINERYETWKNKYPNEHNAAVVAFQRLAVSLQKKIYTELKQQVEEQ